MNNNNQSDIISIIQETSNFFSLNEIQTLSESDYNLLSSYKTINYSGKIDNYVSFIFVIYKNKYYPLLFYKVKQNTKSSISLVGKPIFSKPTLNLLSKVGIEENELHKSSDINSVVISLLGLIEKKELDVKLTNGIVFYSTKNLIQQDIFEYLNNYLYLEKDEKIDSIIHGKNNDKKTDVDFYNYSSEINKITNENKISKVVLENRDLCFNYIYNLISENLSNEGVSILVNNEEEKRKIYKELKIIFGDNLVYSFDEVDKIIKGERQLKNKTEFTLKDLKLKKEYNSFKENSSIYFESIQQLEGIYKKNKLKELSVDNFSKGNNDFKFDIDTSNYTKNDFIIDDEFFKNLSQLKSILNSHITNHIFYGFNEKYGSKVYTEIKQLITNIINCITKLQEDLNNYNSTISLKGNTITTFKEIEELYQNFQVLSLCRGIPLELFDKDFTSEIKQIEELKTSYQKLSSSKLVIKNLADKSIFDLNFLDLISRCHSPNFIKKYRAHRQVFSYLKIKKKNQLKPLIDVIEKYAFSKEKVDELLPKYGRIYNEKISSFDELKNIENMYDSISRFRKISTKDDTYNISNSCIKKLLTKDDEFNKYHKAINTVFNAYNNCKELVNKYIDYFLYDKKDFVHSKIDDNLTFFKNKLKGTSKELEEYLSYLKIEKKISPTLSSAINKCIELNLSLESLSGFFFSNLMNINYSESKREISLFKSEMDKNKFFYFQNIKLIDDFINLERKEKVSIDESIPSEINETRNLLKENYFDDLSNKKTREVLSNKFILILTIDDLVGLDDNIFSNLIVYDKSNYENIVILDLLRLSNKVSFVEEQKYINQFTRNCLVADLSINYLLKKQFDYSKFDKNILSQLNEMLNNKHLKLVKEDFIYILDEKKDKKYILIPSTTLNGPIVAKELNEAFNFIYCNTHNKIMYLDVTKFSFEKKEAFSEMLLPYYR